MVVCWVAVSVPEETKCFEQVWPDDLDQVEDLFWSGEGWGTGE